MDFSKFFIDWSIFAIVLLNIVVLVGLNVLPGQAQSHAAERDVRRVWPRPNQMLDRPEQIWVIALTPDYPPALIIWRGKRRRIKRGDGPKRMSGEWCVRNTEIEVVRDYYFVEDEDGNHYWVYRSHDGINPETGSCKWFLHGI